MKILYVTTIGSTMNFFSLFIRSLLDNGHAVDIATNEVDRCVESCYRQWGCRVYPINTSRSPLNKGNLKAVKQIRNIVQLNQYDIVHCHTPIAAMCTRLACRKIRKHGIRVFYTAHGFHFYKGAPLKNWLIYYPIEKICSRWTDVLITINQEDYALAKKKLKAKQVEYVPGVGIDLKKFSEIAISKVDKREELGIPKNATLLLSVGELNKNKNHETVIRAIADMDVYYIIAGKGELQDYLQRLIDDLGLTDRVKLLGYRKDVSELCRAADIFVFPSYREGLSVSVMEAMASGLPIVCSRIRGNTDLVEDQMGGCLCCPKDSDAFAGAVNKIAGNAELRQKMGEYNLEHIKKFGVSVVEEKMETIYKLLVMR